MKLLCTPRAAPRCQLLSAQLPFAGATSCSEAHAHSFLHSLLLTCCSDTYYIAHVKNACAFLGDGMSRIERLEEKVRGHSTGPADTTVSAVCAAMCWMFV